MGVLSASNYRSYAGSRGWNQRIWFLNSSISQGRADGGFTDPPVLMLELSTPRVLLSPRPGLQGHDC